MAFKSHKGHDRIGTAIVAALGITCHLGFNTASSLKSTLDYLGLTRVARGELNYHMLHPNLIYSDQAHRASLGVLRLLCGWWLGLDHGWQLGLGWTARGEEPLDDIKSLIESQQSNGVVRTALHYQILEGLEVSSGTHDGLDPFVEAELQVLVIQGAGKMDLPGDIHLSQESYISRYSHTTEYRHAACPGSQTHSLHHLFAVQQRTWV